MGLTRTGLAGAAALLASAATAAAAAKSAAPAAPQPAAAAKPTEANVDWAVAARAQPDKPVKHFCALTMSSGAARMQVSLRTALAPGVKPENAGQGSAFFVLTLPDKIVPGDKADLTATLGIPDQKNWGAQPAQWAAAKTGGGMISQFVDNQVGSVIQPLLRGKVFELTVKLPDGSTKDYSMSLKGSGAAVNAFKLCLAQG